MAKQTINIGSFPNDGTGTTLRNGGDLINDNFNEIYTAIGDGTTLNSNILTATSTDTLTNKTLGATTIAGHLIPDANITYDLGSSTFRFRDLYLSGTSIELGSATITASGSSVILPAGSTISGGDGEVVDLNSSQTLTNKTINSASNTITISESNISDLGTYLENVVEDTTPQLGGNLDLNSNDITGTGNINITGNATFSGNLTVNGTTTTVNSTTIEITNSFTFEGTTADGFETVLGVVDPTADRSINLPNASGTVVLKDTTDTLTNKTFDANGTGNSITNIEVADLASGVLDIDLTSVSASDDTLASAKAIKAYVDSNAGGGGIANVVEDTTPQLGGNLDLNSNNITGTGNIDITGSGTSSGFINLSDSNGYLYAYANGSIYQDVRGTTSIPYAQELYHELIHPGGSNFTGGALQHNNYGFYALNGTNGTRAFGMGSFGVHYNLRDINGTTAGSETVTLTIGTLDELYVDRITITNAIHYDASALYGSTFGDTIAAITNYYGYRTKPLDVDANFTVTNAYGFYSDIADVSGAHYNFYAAGTGPNYFAGNLTVDGTVTGPTTDTLLVKDSSGTTLKTIRGV